MHPAPDEQLQKVKKDFERFVLIGSSIYKAAYYALESNGFVSMDAQTDESIVAYHPEENTFIIMRMVPKTLKREVIVIEKTVEFNTTVTAKIA